MNVKLKRVWMSALLIWTASIAVVDADGGSTAATGTLDDPLITKSYFEQNIAARVKDELSKQSLTEEKIKQIISTELAALKSGSQSGAAAPSSASQQPSNNSSDSSTFAVIKLTAGQTIYAGNGTELILRSGKATIVTSDDNGITDVTAGKDLLNGGNIDLNHLLIVPREGRGIKSDPKLVQDTYVMVRGSYLIVNADGSKAP